MTAESYLIINQLTKSCSFERVEHSLYGSTMKQTKLGSKSKKEDFNEGSFPVGDAFGIRQPARASGRIEKILRLRM